MHEFWMTALTDHVHVDAFEPNAILDIGCGEGQWAMEVADIYQDSVVVGVDVALIQEQKSVPQNCEFYIGNMLDKDLQFREEPFDLIQSRSMAMGISDESWPTYVEAIYNEMTPGGWVQFIEMEPFRQCRDQSMPSRSYLGEYEKVVHKVMLNKYGVTLGGLGTRLMEYLEDAGFINIKKEDGITLLGSWTNSRYSSLFY